MRTTTASNVRVVTFNGSPISGNTSDRLISSSLGVELSIGAMTQKNNIIYGIEGFINAVDNKEYVHRPSGEVLRQMSSSYSFGLIGKIGYRLNGVTHVYGLLGAGAQNIIFIQDDANVHQLQKLLILGAGLESKIHDKVAVFAQYDRYIPSDTSINIWQNSTLEYKAAKQNFKIGARYYM